MTDVHTGGLVAVRYARGEIGREEFRTLRSELTDAGRRGSMEELADWVEAADRVLVF